MGLSGRRLVEYPGVGPLRLFDHRVALMESSEATGTGLVATADIPKDTVVWMSDTKGDLTSYLTREELEAPGGPLALAGIEPRDYFDYCWVVGGKYFSGPKISAGGSFEEAKRADATNYINHSCSPTIGYDGDHNMTARVDISAGEAVSYDYCMSDTDLGIFPAFSCECGADECRGALTTVDYRIPALQQRYAGQFLPIVSQTLERELALPATLGEGPYYSLHRDIELRPHPVPKMEKGLFATRFIPAGTVIWKDVPNHEAALIGRTHLIDELKSWQHSGDPGQRELAVWAQEHGHQIGRGAFDLPSRDDLERDYSYSMNHSCDPSCWILTPCVWVARRDIRPGEEIHYDYATTESAFAGILECACGSLDCRGRIYADDWRKPEIQQRYKGHMAEYLSIQNEVGGRSVLCPVP